MDPIKPQQPPIPSSVRRRHTYGPDRKTVLKIGIFTIIVIVIAVVAFRVVRGAVLPLASVNLPGEPVDTSGKPINPELTVLPKATGAVPLQNPQAGPTPQPWDGVSRVTILLMGLDFRDWEAGETPRTDTMILLTVDPLSKTAGMLSIPRDLWVNIPGSGFGKINTAYFIGASQKLPGGGPGLAMETVQDFIGVPIQYYAQIDFYAFEKFIDAIGGLDMHIRQEITVDPLGPGNTVTLKPGVQTLSGAVALAYARDRYTDGGDFDRASRQQEVIMAIRDQVVNFNMLPTLVIKAPELYRDLSAGIHTNLTLQQAIQLAYLGSQINPKNIKRGVIGADMVTFDTSPDGLWIEKPIADKIRLLRDEIFTTAGPASPAAVATSPVELAQKETAKIQVQNGTQTAGLAEKTSDYFKSLGLTVVAPGNAGREYAKTVLIDYTGKPYTMKQLSAVMKVDTPNIFSRYDPKSDVDVVVILGEDWAANNPMP